jgi:hypothetical protein
MMPDGIGGARWAEQGRDMQRLWMALGALAGLTAVAMAALAAHALGDLNPPSLTMVRNAIEMPGPDGHPDDPLRARVIGEATERRRADAAA